MARMASGGWMAARTLSPQMAGGFPTRARARNRGSNDHAFLRHTLNAFPRPLLVGGAAGPPVSAAGRRRFRPAGAESALSPIPVDKESFTEVLRRVCPRVSFQLEQPGPKPEFVAVEMPVKDLKSFQPAAVLQALDWLRESREARSAVVELRDGRLSREQFSKRMESARLPFLSPAALAALTRAPEPARPSPAAPAPAPARSRSDS